MVWRGQFRTELEGKKNFCEMEEAALSGGHSNAESGGNLERLQYPCYR